MQFFYSSSVGDLMLHLFGNGEIFHCSPDGFSKLVVLAEYALKVSRECQVDVGCVAFSEGND